MSAYFITGTDTGVGKTWATLALMQMMQDEGRVVVGMKPVASGCEKTSEGLRNADAAGCQGVVITKDRSCGITNVVDRASAGAVEHLAVCQVTNLSRAMQQLQKAGFWVYGLAAGEGAQSLFTTNLSGNIALVIGSEGDGLRHRTRELCDGLLDIPMVGGVASLNAASASAVALFEVVRQTMAAAEKN